MDQKRWQLIEKIYHSASELEAGELSSFLDSACGFDHELRAEIESLISAGRDGDLFLSDPSLSLGLSILAASHTGAMIGEIIGPYEIIREIGRGGMGEVYLALDGRLNRTVALKILPSFTTGQNSISRFRHEARAAASFSHPNVAHIYEIGEENARSYIAMEYIEGETLRSLLTRQSPTLGIAIDIATQIAMAIAAAHAVHVVHRDIKPENIMIRTDGVVKVVDFGLAKLVEPQRVFGENATIDSDQASRVTRATQTEPGLLIGTANYMSPEQARGQKVDERTDIWSWGIVFFEMLAGKPPFNGLTSSDVIAEILKSDPPELNHRFSPSIVSIVQGSLKKDKDDRYASISELLADLRTLPALSGVDGSLDLPLPLDCPDTPASTDAPPADRVTPFVERSAKTNWLSKEVTKDGAGGEARPPSGEYWLARVFWPTVSGMFTSPISTLRSMGPQVVAGGGLVLILVGFVIYGVIQRAAGLASGPAKQPRVTELTQDGRVKDAAITADGRLLAYVPIEMGKQSLWTRDLNTGDEVRRLPPGDEVCFGMRFTPDGQDLFFLTRKPDSSVNILYKISLAGGEPKKILENVANPPAISPGSDKIAFLRSMPSEHRDALFTANADGTDVAELASRRYPETFSTNSASWSPDGKLIAIGAGRNEGNECAIVAVRVDGGGQIELTPWQWAATGGMDWTGDGSKLIFSARSQGSKVLQVWGLSYPLLNISSVTDDQKSYEEITLADSTRAMVATHTYEVSDIWAVTPAGESRRLTAQGHEGADGLTVTPDGRVIYTHGEYEQSSLWSMNMEGGDRRRLVANNGFLPTASRDGRFIVYVSTDNGIHHIWLTGPDGADNRQLTAGGGENFPGITPDGRWVLYTSLANERNSIFKISTAGGEPVQLTRGAIYVKPVVSPDGTMFECAYRLDENDQWKTAIVPISGGAPVTTFALPNPRGQMIRWSADGKSLLYLDKRGGAQNLWLQPLDGSAAKQVTTFTEDLLLHHDLAGEANGFVLSRGGRRRDVALIADY